MSADAFRSSDAGAATARALARVRVTGGYRVGVRADGSVTRLADLEERGGWRVRFPDPPDGSSVEAVSVNTGGGIIGGDRVRAQIDVAGGHLVATTQAAERIYRSLGPDAEVESTLDVAAGATLAWLPQETILFEGARLKRRLDVAVGATGRVLLVESVVLGRTASGERLRSGALEDRWRVRREGTLIFADTLRLGGDIDAHMSRAAVGGGARAMALVLLVAPDADEKLGTARSAMGAADEVDCGASAWNGMLSVRFMARDARLLRGAVVRVIEALRGTTMPRVWSL